MAKFETTLTGDFNELLYAVDAGILTASTSASFEDGSSFTANGVNIAVRVYERYSWFGSNRVSMTVTIIGQGNQLYFSAITSGGSQAVFLKINTVGEEAFLDKAVQVIQQYIDAHPGSGGAPDRFGY